MYLLSLLTVWSKININSEPYKYYYVCAVNNHSEKNIFKSCTYNYIKMSDNFIPLTQSTPVQNRSHQDKNQQQRYNNRQQNVSRRGGHNKWRNNSRSSYGNNSSNNSYGQDRNNIDAYLHPSMLQDPWESLRQSRNQSST